MSSPFAPMKIQSLKAGEPAIPPDPPNALKEIGRAWEGFVASGEFVGTLPRPVIAQSWQRSRELGINPFMDRAPTVISPEEIEAILLREDLGRAGRQVLDDFTGAVEGTGHVILLADARGRIVYWAGHRGLQRILDRLNLAPGGDWAETTVGPNGIGTPLTLGWPELVFGSEHYCQGWHPWICYGCPVREPGTGRILGGVDITGPAKKAHALTFALTVAIARSIEQLFLVFELQRREALRTISRGFERRWPGEGILVVSESGRVVEMNSAATRAFGMRPAALINVPLAELIPELWTPVQQSAESRSAVEAEIAVRMPAGAEKVALCRVEPIIREGRALGSVVILSDRSSAPTRERSRTAMRSPGPGPTKYTFADILGNSPVLRQTLNVARAAAGSPHQKPVLLVGESGTGKELVAQAIHAESRRASGPFVAVDCGALPRELVESELFGYAPGAFTGARREGQTGKFEAAHGGTLFLDEIDSLPMELQVKFLRALEGGEIVRLGSATPVSIDVRIVAACSVDLRRSVQEGTFRLDLYHRLSVIEIFLPPLRERGEDILLLASAFIKEGCVEVGKDPLTISPEVADCLRAYPWPGNIRELQNVCTRWALTVEGAEVLLQHVARHIQEAVPLKPLADGGLRTAEDAIIRRTLMEADGNVGEAARRLGIAKTTIYRRLKRRSTR